MPNWHVDYIEQRLLTEKSCQSAEFLENSAVDEPEQAENISNGQDDLPTSGTPPELIKAIAQYMPLNKQLLAEMEKYTIEDIAMTLEAFKKALSKQSAIANPAGYFVGVLRNVISEVKRSPKQTKPLTRQQLRKLVEKHEEYPIKVRVNGQEFLGELCGFFDEENAVYWQTEERSYFSPIDEVEIYKR